jgi:hypothetical protein
MKLPLPEARKQERAISGFSLIENPSNALDKLMACIIIIL